MLLLPRAATLRALSLAALAASLAACDSLNIFEEKETPLPGERRAVFSDTGTGVAPRTSEGAAVSVSAARANADWSQPGGDAANAPGNLVLGGGSAWRAAGGSLGKHDARSGAGPIAYGGRVFVYSDDGSVTAYSLNGGGRAWTASARPEGLDDRGVPGGGVAAADGRVVATTGFRTVAAFSADSGNRLWMTTINEPGRGSPTIAGGRVYFVSSKNTVYALNLADGKVVWSYTGIPESAGLVSAASPAVSGNRVIVPSSAGEILALDAGKGTVQWQGSLARAARFSAVSGMSDVTARPVAAGGVVYAAGVSGRMVAIRENTGQMVWEKALASAHTPAVSGNGIFVVTLANELVALDRNTGKIAWATRLPQDKRETWAGPTIAGGNLWVGSSAGRLLAVNASTGQIVSEREVGNPIYLPPIVAGGSLIVQSAGGSLTALQ